ncbi:unnamed protein product [Clavelina lepadiformis]|uniref:Major facilitator superfamily (MFS) profile domain-containing protein n=1 Tax=Clavelina lepadiformis TaxID=159417 RepID=A0ABP0FNR0_CLALP
MAEVDYTAYSNPSSPYHFDARDRDGNDEDDSHESEILFHRRHPDCNDNKPGTYQEVFKATGFGFWHFLLLLQCGWANASDAIEIMCISFTMDSMQSMGLSHADATPLTVVLFLGMMIGGYLWGSLADSWGRRRVVIFSLAINGLFGGFSALAQTYWLLLLLRFLSGIGAGGSLPVCFSYFSEFQPNNKRGAMISALATSWMAGNLIAAGLAWLILPEMRNLAPYSPFGDPWRLFMIICAVPSLTSSFFFILMPESPKFLMEKGRPEKALEVFRKVYRYNFGKELPFTRIISEDGHCHRRSSSSFSQKSTCSSVTHLGVWRICQLIYRFFKSIGRTIRRQFYTVCGSGGHSRKNSSLLMCVYFSIAFGGYGVTMWLPVLMDRAEKFSGSPCSAHTVNATGPTNATSGGAEKYVDVLIGTAAQLPSNVLAILIIDRVGGKLVLAASLLMSGASVMFMWLVSSKIDAIIMSAVFQCVSNMVWNAVDVITPEMFDTSVRASATGFLTALSRIASILGNLIFGLFIDSSCSVPIITVAVIFCVGFLASIFLPNTRQIDLE